MEDQEFSSLRLKFQSIMFHKFEIVDQKQISQGEPTMRDNEGRLLEDADCLTVTEEIFQASYF